MSFAGDMVNYIAKLLQQKKIKLIQVERIERNKMMTFRMASLLLRRLHTCPESCIVLDESRDGGRKLFGLLTRAFCESSVMMWQMRHPGSFTLSCSS